MIATEDDHTGQLLTAEADRLTFNPSRVILDPREEWEPTGDALVVCGPTSAHIGHKLMASDPVLGMGIGDGGLWHILDRVSGETFPSPMDVPEPRRADHAYIARHSDDGAVTVHIAELHALGSVGAAEYLIANVAGMWAELGDSTFSMAITANFDGLDVTKLSVLIPPRRWT